MTIEEIQSSDKEMLEPKDICGPEAIFPCLPRTFRQQVEKDSSQFQFKIVKFGRRIYIPRRSFLAYLENDPWKGVTKQ